MVPVFFFNRYIYTVVSNQYSDFIVYRMIQVLSLSLNSNKTFILNRGHPVYIITSLSCVNSVLNVSEIFNILKGEVRT